MNNAFSSNFIAIYDRLLYFWGEIVCLEIVFKTSYIFFALACGSVAQW